MAHRILAPLYSAALAASFIAASFIASDAHAQYASEGVVYSFSEVRLGAQRQYALQPFPAEQVRPDLPPQASIPAAFGLLRNGKPATYGNTSVVLTDADLAAGRAQVVIDPSAIQNFEIIAAETVYTFTQLGVGCVTFPQVEDACLTRADIPYAGYTMRVPMWQALVGGGRIHGAEIRLPNGELMPSAAFYAAWEAGDDALYDQALSYFSGDHIRPQYGLLGVVAGLAIPGWETAVVPLLSDDEPSMRDMAVRALAQSTSEAAWEGVLGVMNEDPEPALRELAAQFLAQSPLDAYRFYEVFYRAQSLDTEGRLAAINEAAALVDDRVAGALRPFLVDAEPRVRQAGIDGLEQQTAWSVLRGAMDDEALADDTRLAAATALANSAVGADQAAGLEYRGFHMPTDPAITALDRLAGLAGINPRPAVERFLSHPDVNVAVHAAGILGRSGDAAALDALSGAGAAEPAIDLVVAVEDAAYGIMIGLPSAEVDAYANGRDAFLKRAAYRALGTLAQEGRAGASVYDLLVQGLAAPDAGIRGASARALGAYGTEEALAQILTVSEDPAAEVQGDVALALGNFQGEAFTDQVNPLLITYVQSGEPVIIAGALDSLGALGQTQLLNVVMTNVQFPDPRVRASAMRAAVALVDPAAPRPVINAVSAGLQDELVGNRVLACELLGTFENDLAILALSPLVNDRVPEVRFAAIRALGASGNAGSAGALMSLLEDPEREIRLAALDALQVLGMGTIVPDLQGYLAREQDEATRAALQSTIDILSAQGS